MKKDLWSQKSLVSDVDGKWLLSNTVDTVVLLHPFAGFLIILGKFFGDIRTYI